MSTLNLLKAGATTNNPLLYFVFYQKCTHLAPAGGAQWASGPPVCAGAWGRHWPTLKSRAVLGGGGGGAVGAQTAAPTGQAVGGSCRARRPRCHSRHPQLWKGAGTPVLASHGEKVGRQSNALLRERGSGDKAPARQGASPPLQPQPPSERVPRSRDLPPPPPVFTSMYVPVYTRCTHHPSSCVWARDAWSVPQLSQRRGPPPGGAIRRRLVATGTASVKHSSSRPRRRL